MIRPTSNRDYPDPFPDWYEKNEATIAKSVGIVGLAIFFIGMGAMSAALATPARDFHVYCGDAQEYPTVVAVLGGAVGGTLGLILSCCLLYGALKEKKTSKVQKITREDVINEISHLKWQNLGKFVGFAVLCFGIGMIIASGLILDHSVSEIKSLAKYYKDIASWVDSTEKMMAAMATIGSFIAIGGGALLLSMGGWAALRNLYERLRKKDEKENLTHTTLTEGL